MFSKFIYFSFVGGLFKIYWKSVFLFSFSFFFFIPFADSTRYFGAEENRALLRLSATQEELPFIIHYEPTPWMEYLLPKFKKNQKKALQELETRLQMKYEGEIHLFVYLNVDEMQKITKSQGVGAYATNNILHTPFYTHPHHELTHILCLQWNLPLNKRVPHDIKETNYDQPEYKFIVEGFADAMTHLGRLQLPIRHWVAFDQKLGRLPSLKDLLQNFPHTQTGFSGYWIAGAFFEYLIERYGIDLVKQYYFAPKRVLAIFGREFEVLEKEWLEWLEATPFSIQQLEIILADMFGEALFFEKEISFFEGDVLLQITADDIFYLFEQGRLVGKGLSWQEIKEFSLTFDKKARIEIVVLNQGGVGGLLVEGVSKKEQKKLFKSDSSWKVTQIGNPSVLASIINEIFQGKETTLTQRSFFLECFSLIKKNRFRKNAVEKARAFQGIWGQVASLETKMKLNTMAAFWIWNN